MNKNEFTKDSILQKINPVLLPSQRVPENVHQARMSGFAGASVCFALFEDDDDGRHMKLLTDECVEKFDIADDELLTAINSVQYNYTFDLLSKVLDLPDRDMNFPLYTLTNDQYTFGAGLICVDSILIDIAKKIGCDFYILPSSIHELLCVPVSNFSPDDDTEEVENNLLRMVWEVNHKDVEPCDRLSNHIYYVDHETLDFRTIRAKRLA